MPHRRSALTALAVAAVLGLTACGRAGTAPVSATTPATAVSADPLAELTAATARLGAQTARLRVSMTGLMSMTGVVDPVAGTARMKMDMGSVSDGTQAEIRKVGADVWVKFKGPLGRLLGTNDRWLHLGAADLTAASIFNVLPGDDPAGVNAMVKAVTGVRRAGPDGFAGTLDLTRTPRYDARTLSALGAGAAAVPFTARIDPQGRLVELTTDLSAVVSGAGDATTRFSDFGVPVDVARPPAAQTTDLPTDLRNVING